MVVSHRTWQMTDAFWNDWIDLENNSDKGLIVSAIEALLDTPSPENRAVRIMKGVPKDSRGLTFHRMRKGDYRILYTYDREFVYLRRLAPKTSLDKDEDYIELIISSSENAMINTFRLKDDEIFSAHPHIEDEDLGAPEPTMVANDESEYVNDELLDEAKVPTDLWGYFSTQKISDLKLSQPSPEHDRWAKLIVACLNEIEDYLTTPDSDQRAQIRRTIFSGRAKTLEDILRGEISFEESRLELSKDQDRAVNFAFDAGGPVLIRGGAGTGKSLVAQYRVKQSIKRIGQSLPSIASEAKILFTTYTHALKEDSLQSLRKILGEQSDLVECKVSDEVIMTTFRECRQLQKPKQGLIKSFKLWFRARKGLCIDANGLIASILSDQQLLEKRFSNDEIEFLTQLSSRYLAQEIESVIYGHQILDKRSYHDHQRTGRRVEFRSTTERSSIWKLKEIMEEMLSKQGKMTFAQLHFKTAQLLNEVSELRRDWRELITTYDAAIVDEGQDLSPVTLAILMKLVETPDQLFVVADSTQAIFRAGDTNLEGYEGIDFSERVLILDKGHRTTQQISQAATNFLQSHRISSGTRINSHYRQGPLPSLWKIMGSGEALLEKEVDFIADEIGKFPKPRLDQVAIFTASSKQCKAIQKQLKKRGLPSSYLKSKTYKPTGKQEIRVMPLQSVKGIEFPIVYIAGLQEDFPRIPSKITEAGLHELLDEHYRYLYVGMTRAISLLTVCVPQYGATDISKGFDENLWNIETK